jgi:phospholipase C
MHMLSRRQALLRLVSVGGGLALSALTPMVLRAEGPTDDSLDQDQELPAPGRSGIEHVIVVMMENRSFDHFLGWLPHANGKQAGLRFADNQGVSHATHALAPDFQGCGFADPDHSFEGGRIEYDNGRCDGWLRAGANDVYSIGYYVRADLPFFGQIAPRFVSPDHYFCAILGPTFPNRIYQHAAQTDRLSNTLALSTLPTALFASNDQLNFAKAVITSNWDKTVNVNVK